MTTATSATLHRVTALQPVKFRTMVTRSVETRVADRLVQTGHSQDEWVFLKAGEVYESSNPIRAIHPDYLPLEQSTRSGGVPVVFIPSSPRPLDFHGLLRLETVAAPPPAPVQPKPWE